MLSPKIAEDHQIPLIHEVHADDHYLLNTLDGEWFEILHTFPWEDYRPTPRPITTRSMSLITVSAKYPRARVK